MLVTSLKFYPLPDGRFVVSYFDELRRTRIQKIIDEEFEAKSFYTGLKEKRSVKDQKRDFKSCTIEELFGVFLEEVPSASIRKSPQLIRDFLDQFAIFKPDHLDELKLRGFYTQQKLEYDYTAYSLSTRKYQVQGFFKWMVSRGIIEKSPQDHIHFGKTRIYRRPPIWLSPEKIKEAIGKAQTLSPGFIYPILLLMNETAAKTMDVMHLKWNDIDFRNKTVRLWEGPKIQRRELEISETVLTAIKRIDQVSDYVFTNLESRPHVKAVLTRELRTFQRQAKLDTGWVYRDIRHSFAVNFVQGGGDMRRLQKIMGHSHVQMTFQLYGSYQIHGADFFDSEAVRGTRTTSSESCKF